MSRALSAAALSLLFVAAAPATAQTRRPTERVVLDVEILDRDPTPLIPCGRLGAQPRDVTARVLTVVAGHFEGDTVLLSWPRCEWRPLEVGQRARVTIRRFTDAAASPTTRYRVRDERAIPTA